MPQTFEPERLVDDPLAVVVEGAAVVITGPIAAPIAITPDTALRWADALRTAAAQAQAQASAGDEPLPILPIDQRDSLQ